MSPLKTTPRSGEVEEMPPVQKCPGHRWKHTKPTRWLASNFSSSIKYYQVFKYFTHLYTPFQNWSYKQEETRGTVPLTSRYLRIMSTMQWLLLKDNKTCLCKRKTHVRLGSWKIMQVSKNFVVFTNLVFVSLHQNTGTFPNLELKSTISRLFQERCLVDLGTPGYECLQLFSHELRCI